MDAKVTVCITGDIDTFEIETIEGCLKPYFEVLDGSGKQPGPKPSDGKTAERIVNILAGKVNMHAHIDAAG
jgi:hypothetical protein